jgi:phosphohistidine phosphatase
MKKLLLIRHAKAVQSIDLKDFDRNLTEKGIDNAKNMGKFLSKLDTSLDLAICSPAIRAKETMEIIFDKMKIKPKIIYNELIYDNDEKKIINLIKDTDNSINTLAIIGHNPSMENITILLTKQKFPHENFSTCGVALIEFDIKSWDEIKNETGKLILFKTPKDL